jgi:predicted N-acyltransferase
MIAIERVASIRAVDVGAWRRIEPPNFPFFDYEFLAALEASGSIGDGTGWAPIYLLARRNGELCGAICLYAKSDSYGEYIFDWQWARAYAQYRIPYYPKIVAAVPFTPATGPKILLAAGDHASDVAHALCSAATTLYEGSNASSFHALFLPETESALFAGAGFAIRHTSQYQWRNAGYARFDDYLAAMTGKRRRQIERERRTVAGTGLELACLTGAELTARHAEAMEAFYLATTDRKNANAYLQPGFFQHVFREMPDRIVLALASRAGEPIAAALAFSKGNALFGRYWGAVEDHRDLHFELCYYQLITYAIGRGMALFESGAQGHHKLARGFLPTRILSAHRVRHPEFRRAIEEYIASEREQVAAALAEELAHSPFRVNC